MFSILDLVLRCILPSLYFSHFLMFFKTHKLQDGLNSPSCSLNSEGSIEKHLLFNSFSLLSYYLPLSCGTITPAVKLYGRPEQSWAVTVMI